ncbi:hypothetical protein BDY21DRAFT_184911 [Lineolata rhizophorae]|uniref:Uncharacterized protein n=1 Tax=Lineolata rhizophorae TaxID=578093 RepID=A0A6A6P834_9PEZI|nr:hypothetical protein BDY21DRAFT_184911 [Lineolata rhizophorae]
MLALHQSGTSKTKRRFAYPWLSAGRLQSGRGCQRGLARAGRLGVRRRPEGGCAPRRTSLVGLSWKLPRIAARMTEARSLMRAAFSRSPRPGRGVLVVRWCERPVDARGWFSAWEGRAAVAANQGAEARRQPWGKPAGPSGSPSFASRRQPPPAHQTQRSRFRRWWFDYSATAASGRGMRLMWGWTNTFDFSRSQVLFQRRTRSLVVAPGPRRTWYKNGPVT